MSGLALEAGADWAKACEMNTLDPKESSAPGSNTKSGIVLLRLLRQRRKQRSRHKPASTLKNGCGGRI